MKILPRILFVSSIIASLSGCTSSRYSIANDGAPDQDIDISQVANATPRNEPHSRYGNPAKYTVRGKTYYVLKSAEGFTQKGIASWYGKKFHGHRTSSGEPFNMYAMTAAHKNLPLPTYVEVRNVDNNRTIIVRVNDRGPFHSGRIIDLSYAAAKKLRITATGTGNVEIKALTPADLNSKHTAKTPKLSNNVNTIPEGARLYLQLGAFNSKQNAHLLENKLQNRYQELIISTSFNNERGVYRVRIGPLQSVADADRLAQNLNNDGYPHSHVVID
jgi:rare lipoprotein A